MPKLSKTILQLEEWANAATPESIESIKAFMAGDLSDEEYQLADMALEEAQYLYYMPVNEEEEQDFLLCKLIAEYEELLMSIHFQLEEVRTQKQKALLEQGLHAKVMEEVDEANREQCAEWVAVSLFSELDEQISELEVDEAYLEKMINAAQEEIKTKKYQEADLNAFELYAEDDQMDEEYFEDEEEEDEEEFTCCGGGCC